MSSRLPTLAEALRWGSALLVIATGWAAGHGLAAGMDSLHAAAAGFSLSGSIFLATALRDLRTPERSTVR